MRCQYFDKNLLTLKQPSSALFIIVIISCCLLQRAQTLPTAEFEAHHLVDEPKFVVIAEDVIPDVENTTQKVIRVNPLDLPALRADPTGVSGDSDLYKIKALLPAYPQRSYVSTKRMRRPRKPPAQMVDSQDTPITRQLPVGKLHKPKHQQPHKKKQLHFLYNQEAQDGRIVGKSLRVHVAPGAYPVYYAVSKTNGRFGKYPIKGFSSEREFQKYLIKSKLEPISLKDRYES